MHQKISERSGLVQGCRKYYHNRERRAIHNSPKDNTKSSNNLRPNTVRGSAEHDNQYNNHHEHNLRQQNHHHLQLQNQKPKTKKTMRPNSTTKTNKDF